METGLVGSGTLAELAVRSVCLLGLVAVTGAVAAGRASAAVRHNVWAFGLYAVLALPLLAFALPGWGVLPARAVPTGSAATAAAAAPAGSAPSVGVEVRFDFEGNAGPGVGWSGAPVASAAAAPPAPQGTGTGNGAAPNPPVEGVSPTPVPGDVAVDSMSRQPASAGAAAGTATGAAAGHAAGTGSGASTGPGLRWPAWVWAAGAVVLLGRLALARIALARFRARCREVTSGPLHRSLGESGTLLSMPGGVRLLAAPGNPMPMSWGVLSRYVVLPEGAAGWDPDRTRSVLLHELAHLQRHDPLHQLVAQVACALYWFNPLVWVAAWRMRADRERACDDRVLAAGVTGSTYAGHLLGVVAGAGSVPAAAGAAVAMARSRSRTCTQLESRVTAALDPALDRRRATSLGLAASLAAGVLVALPVATARPAPQPQNAGDEITVDLDTSDSDEAGFAGDAAGGLATEDAATDEFDLALDDLTDLPPAAAEDAAPAELFDELLGEPVDVAGSGDSETGGLLDAGREAGAAPDRAPAPATGYPGGALGAAGPAGGMLNPVAAPSRNAAPSPNPEVVRAWERLVQNRREMLEVVRHQFESGTVSQHDMCQATLAVSESMVGLARAKGDAKEELKAVERHYRAARSSLEFARELFRSQGLSATELAEAEAAVLHTEIALAEAKAKLDAEAKAQAETQAYREALNRIQQTVRQQASRLADGGGGSAGNASALRSGPSAPNSARSNPRVATRGGAGLPPAAAGDSTGDAAHSIAQLLGSSLSPDPNRPNETREFLLPPGRSSQETAEFVSKLAGMTGGRLSVIQVADNRMTVHADGKFLDLLTEVILWGGAGAGAPTSQGTLPGGPVGGPGLGVGLDLGSDTPILPAGPGAATGDAPGLEAVPAESSDSGSIPSGPIEESTPALGAGGSGGSPGGGSGR